MLMQFDNHCSVDTRIIAESKDLLIAMKFVPCF